MTSISEEKFRVPALASVYQGQVRLCVTRRGYPAAVLLAKGVQRPQDTRNRPQMSLAPSCFLLTRGPQACYFLLLVRQAPPTSLLGTSWNHVAPYRSSLWSVPHAHPVRCFLRSAQHHLGPCALLLTRTACRTARHPLSEHLSVHSICQGGNRWEAFMNQSAGFPQSIWNLPEEFPFGFASCRPSDSLSSGLLGAWRYKPLFFPKEESAQRAYILPGTRTMLL